MIELVLTYLSYGLAVLVAIYIHRILFFYRGLSRLPLGKNQHEYIVTVIIPARNEEHNIVRCLESVTQQNYPPEKMSVIIVDDSSEDRTAATAQAFAQKSRIPIVVIPVDEFADIKSPKIRALSHGLQHTPASIILTTDADCVVPSNWIRAIVSYFEEGVGVVTGVTVFEKHSSLSRLFWGIQFLDFISYTSIAAGAIGMNRVLISNGSNLAFLREAFDESGGFESLKHINTGDDSLLAQKIVSKGNWRARFAIRPDATVMTTPALSFTEMFHQRLRWVGQTAYYPSYMMFFMICTFAMFVGLAISIPMTFFTWNSIPWIVIIGKFGVDYLTMNRFTAITKTREAMRYFIPTALFHIPFILLATIGGYFFTFEWKNRTMKKESAR